MDEVLAWIKRTELAKSSLSTSSLAFNRYCWPYLHGRKGKPHTVWNLRFLREQNDEGNWQNILKKGWNISIPIKIADVNPPEYIIEFRFIEFK